MRYDYTVVEQMPVILEHLKPGKALRYPVPKYVSVRFRGSGWLIAGLYLTPGLEYFIDASSLGPDRFMITGRDLPEHVKLPFALQLVDILPETLHLALDDYVEKRVRVAPRIVADFHEGYGQVGQMQCSPESVVLAGAKSQLDALQEWPTVYHKMSDLRSSIDADVDLEESSNFSVSTVQKEVRVQLNVQPYAEKIFSGLPITVATPPLNREVIFIPPRMDLVVRGGIDQLARLTNMDFDAVVQYESLLRDDPEFVVPNVIAPPEVKIVGRKPEKFKFIIRKRL